MSADGTREYGTAVNEPPDVPNAGPRDPLVRAFKAQPALTLAIAASVLIALRLAAVSAYDLPVVLALLSAAGPANVLLGSGLTMVPVYAHVVVIIATRYARSRRLPDEEWLAIGGLILLAALFSLSMAPAAVLAVVLAFWLALSFFERRRGRPVGVAMTRRSYVALGARELVGVHSDSMARSRGGDHHGRWPTNRLRQSSDTRWTILLEQQPRTVSVIDTSSMVSRAPCQPERSVWSATAFDLLRRAPVLAACPAPAP